jgi:uncharacterized protein (TIGR02996 family)
VEIEELERWLRDPNRSQREKLRLIEEQWIGPLRRLSDEELPAALRLIRKAINSRKLWAQRDALLRELRRDGLAGDAPLPAPPGPPERPDPDREEPALREADDGRDPSLEAAIARDPEAREPYLVYGDWLEARGDPRGQLIAVQHELNKSAAHRRMLAAQEELLREHGERLLGPLRDCDDMLTDVQWYMGFIRSCRLHYSLERFNGDRVPNVKAEQALGWLLDGPGRFLQHLVVGNVTHDDHTYGTVCQVLGAQPRPTLRSLFLGDFTYEDCELNWSSIGDASVMWPALPGLERLKLRSGEMTLGEIVLPALREFTTVTGGLDRDSAMGIARARWPLLEKLSLQYGPQGTHDFAVVEPILAARGLENLRHLGLTNCGFTDEICHALPRSEILPRLEELDLSMGTMSDDGARVLFDHPQAFGHLELLNVDDNYLTAAARPLLEGLCGNVLFGDQRDDGGDPSARYASAYE